MYPFWCILWNNYLDKIEYQYLSLVLEAIINKPFKFYYVYDNYDNIYYPNPNINNYNKFKNKNKKKYNNEKYDFVYFPFFIKNSTYTYLKSELNKFINKSREYEPIEINDINEF